MDNICKICGENVTEDSHYYKNHKLKIGDYYHKYYPKSDLYTKQPIVFKSRDSYFLADFNDKRNLKKYLESISKEEGLNYLKNWLSRRKEIKNLIYAPGQFEVKSLCFPTISFFHKYYGQNSYEKICLELGLQLKYDYNNSPEIKHNPIEILLDSREQKPYKLELPVKISTLNFADYCPNPNPENLFIERKELGDWAGVMSKGYERFVREIQRAKDNNAYIVILIESTYSDIQSINYLPQTKWIKASSEYLLKHARDLYLKFDNFQMVCGGKRSECIQLFDKIIKIKNIQTSDIQYFVDTKQIYGK
jgi:hypothetical protein